MSEQQEYSTQDDDMTESGDSYSEINPIIVGPAGDSADIEDYATTQVHRDMEELREGMIGLSKNRGGFHGYEEDRPEPNEGALPFDYTYEVKESEIQKREGFEQTYVAPSIGPDRDVDQQVGYDSPSSFGVSIENFVIEPPFRMGFLCRIVQESGALGRNIAAMVTNIDSFGYRLDPVVDFTAPDSADRVRDLMIIRSAEEQEAVLSIDEGDLDKLIPSPEEVDKKKSHWSILSRIEKHRVKCFFDNISPGVSFTTLRRETRQHLETMGNSAWEIFREDPNDPNSKITHVYLVNFIGMKLVQSDQTPTVMKMKVKKDDLSYETVEVERYFRRFQREMEVGTYVYYKEFGDPRTVSKETGRYYESIEALRSHEGPSAMPGGELKHWKQSSPFSPYGIPRWIGTALPILGTRSSEEVNLTYFNNKAIPPMVLLVSGGRISDESVNRIKEHIKDQIKGKNNFHNILILEALPADADAKLSDGKQEHAGKMRIELKPMKEALQDDSLFQKYEAANEMKVGRSFRQSSLMTGDARDMNRATAQTVKGITEEQVYQPERDEFDSEMAMTFMPSRGYVFWIFKTNAPVQRTPNDLIENVKKALESGALTINEARRVLSDAFSTEFDFIDEGWAKLPTRLAIEALKRGMLAQAGLIDQKDMPSETEDQSFANQFGDMVESVMEPRLAEAANSFYDQSETDPDDVLA